MRPKANRDEGCKSDSRESEKSFAVEKVFQWLRGEAEHRRDVPAINDVFESIPFARHTIAEIKAPQNVKLKISRKENCAMLWDVFPPVQRRKDHFFGSHAKTLRTRLLCHERADPSFLDHIDDPTDLGVAHKHHRGVAMVRHKEKAELEFVIYISALLMPDSGNPNAAQLLHLRTQTFAAEFLSCWLMYEQIRDTLQGGGGLADLSVVPTYHPEPWAVSRLLCPTKELRKSLKWIPKLEYSQLFDLVDKPTVEHGKFFHYWEHKMQVSKDVVANAIASYLIENHIRRAMGTFGCLLEKRMLDVEDLREHRNDERLAEFWKYLADESPLNTGDMIREEWEVRGRVIQFVENALYWARLTHTEWGNHFCDLAEE